MKGRIIDRARNRYLTRSAKIRHAFFGKEKSPRGKKAREDYEQYCYYEQKMRQNRMTEAELREKLDGYRRMIR